MDAKLTYYIIEGVLTGLADDCVVHMSALSGGGAGSTEHQPTSAANNPYMEALKTTGAATAPGHIHGGPFPPGRYQILKPGASPSGHIKLCAQLVHAGWKPMGRDSLLIHGPGPHGSDGCVVVLNRDQFQDLMDKLTNTNGGTLLVEESMSGDRFA